MTEFKALPGGDDKGVKRVSDVVLGRWNGYPVLTARLSVPPPQLKTVLHANFKTLVCVFNHFASLSRPGNGFTLGVSTVWGGYGHQLGPSCDVSLYSLCVGSCRGGKCCWRSAR